jgi:ATP-binding cassette subfamily F protein 3
MRIALAKMLVRKPAVLLLNEPTNHLDLAACAWLEGYLAEYAGMHMVVSHADEPDTREIVLTEDMAVGYYAQDQSETLDESRSVVDEVLAQSPSG